jgi:hypothetical protein
MLSTRDRTEICTKCSSDLALSRGAGRVVLFEGDTIAVPAAMELLRCHGCGCVYPTQEQAQELRAASRDLSEGLGRTSGRGKSSSPG